jgi:hypothetical protein
LGELPDFLFLEARVSADAARDRAGEAFVDSAKERLIRRRGRVSTKDCPDSAHSRSRTTVVTYPSESEVNVPCRNPGEPASLLPRYWSGLLPFA